MLTAIEADISNWSFFHGTSKLHAHRILQRGSTPYISEIGALRMAGALWARMKSRYGGVDAVVSRLQDLDCTFTLSAAMALASISGEVPAKNYEYGDLFATLGLQRAARYALRSPFGSELLGVLADVIKALETDGEDLEPLLREYPELVRVISHPSPPVVLEFCGLATHQVADEHGEAIDTSWITSTADLLQVLHPSNGGTCFDVRLRGFTNLQVKRVYHLDRLSPGDIEGLTPPGEPSEILEAAIRRC